MTIFILIITIERIKILFYITHSYDALLQHSGLMYTANCLLPIPNWVIVCIISLRTGESKLHDRDNPKIVAVKLKKGVFILKL